MRKYVLVTVLLHVIVFFHEEATSYAATCFYNNFDCERGTVCCRMKCNESCINQSCTRDFDCGGTNEYCGVNKKCFAGCQSNSQCRNGKVCCRMVHKCKENCLGESCETSDDCGGTSEDCPSNTKKCRTRESYSKTFPVWLIVVIAVVILIVILILSWGIRTIWLICRYGPFESSETRISENYWRPTAAGGGGGGGC